MLERGSWDTIYELPLSIIRTKLRHISRDRRWRCRTSSTILTDTDSVPTTRARDDTWWEESLDPAEYSARPLKEWYSIWRSTLGSRARGRITECRVCICDIRTLDFSETILIISYFYITRIFFPSWDKWCESEIRYIITIPSLTQHRRIIESRSRDGLRVGQRFFNEALIFRGDVR